MTPREPRLPRHWFRHHHWKPVDGEQWPGGDIKFSEECECGARRARWHRWVDGPLTDEQRAVIW